MPKHEGKHPDLSGPEFAHLGHFRNPKFVAQGHNQTNPKKVQKEEEDEILREAEAAIKRLEAAGFGKEEAKPMKARPKPMPEKEEEFAGIRARQRALRQLGVR